ncbi:MAG: uracil-DNA glycosylase [Alphaproteobacteria bacterium]|nr:uracil-DNA glycosylase [Alphaproteobacteria bacterium]
MTCPAPDKDCAYCPRLAEFRHNNRKTFPDKFNAPVPSFGPEDARLLIVGLAPGLKGANFSGRPFTGDYAGVLLYSTLLKYGFAQGTYGAAANDGLTLKNCRITNAVRCVPPENKPTPAEINQCLGFLKDEFAALKNAKVILSLGSISHNSVVRACGGKLTDFKFKHGAVHDMPNGKVLVDSYHCSRYNTQTRRLTEEMFHGVFEKIKNLIT